MIVYHGSNRIVDHPDTLHTFRNLDFGKGFYVTTVKEQAERWAKRKADFAPGTKPILNCYEMRDLFENLCIRNFGDDLSTWIDFICQCRDGGEEYKNYDVIIGKVANDKVFRVVDMYHQGIWEKERALKEIRVYPTYDQIAFITQKAIDELLIFQQGNVIQ